VRDGDFDLAGLLSILWSHGVQAPISVEVLSAELAQQPPGHTAHTPPKQPATSSPPLDEPATAQPPSIARAHLISIAMVDLPSKV
jgi:hypothetical protein